MKAIVYQQYGSPDVLQLEEVATPIPQDGQVLIKVHAAATNPLDWHFIRGTPYFMRLFAGVLKPKTIFLGADVAGVVEAVGRNVDRFEVGDAVFGYATAKGSFAEYVCVDQKVLAKKPANVLFKEAAAVPIAALTALQGLRDVGSLQTGEKVLVNGASGGVGTYTVQIAKALGAEVTGVCSSRNVDMVRSLGADHVIDYTQENFTQSQQRYDVIIDNVANHSVADYMAVLNPNGRCAIIGFSMSLMVKVGLFGRLISMRHGKKISLLSMAVTKEDMVFLADLLEKEEMVSVIDRCYPLNQVAEAIHYLEEGHAQGKVVIPVLESCG